MALLHTCSNATPCMVPSGLLVHYDHTLQKIKEGTKHNRLTSISTSFIDSMTENAEEMGLSGMVVKRYMH